METKKTCFLSKGQERLYEYTHISVELRNLRGLWTSPASNCALQKTKQLVGLQWLLSDLSVTYWLSKTTQVFLTTLVFICRQ